MATILLVEDDRLSHRLVEKIYSSAGHEVLLAENPQGGWDLLRNRMLIDLVVLDSQLGSDWGWTFLQEVRRRPFFRDLPVVVYTAHTEREDVLHYVRLGVQSVQVKPFKAAVLLGELEKTLKTGRLSRWLQPPPEACARLKIDMTEYAGLLNSAIAMLEDDRKLVMRYLTATNDGRLWSALSRMKQRLPELGVRIIEELVTLAEEQLRRDEIPGAVEALAAIDALTSILRQRALKLLQMGDSVVNTAQRDRVDGRPLPKTVNHPAAAPPGAPSVAVNGLAAMARRIAGQPIWAYGELLWELREKLRIGSAHLATTVERLRDRPQTKTFLDVLGWIEAIPETNFQDAAFRLREVRGFEEACQRILLRSGVATKAPGGQTDWVGTASRLGVPKTVVYSVLGVLARQPLGGPLDLRPLRERQLLTMLLAFEMGRLLKIANYHRLAAAGLAKDLGLLLAAWAEPGSLALILAMVSGGADLFEAEQAVWGLTHRDLGARFLAAAGAAALCQEAAIGKPLPGTNPSTECDVMLTVLDVVEDLAALSEADSAAQAGKIRERLLASDYPAWPALRKANVALPVDLSEFVDLLATLTGSASWIAHEASV